MKDHEKAQLINELKKEIRILCGTSTPHQLRALISRIVCKYVDTNEPAQATVDWIKFKYEIPKEEGNYLTYWSDGTIETFMFDCEDIGKESIVLNGINLLYWAENVAPPEPENPFDCIMRYEFNKCVDRGKN